MPVVAVGRGGGMGSEGLGAEETFRDATTDGTREVTAVEGFKSILAASSVDGMEGSVSHPLPSESSAR